MLLLRGATHVTRRPKTLRKRFNTCSSCEEQLDGIGYQYAKPIKVSIHAPLARSNSKTAGASMWALFQYMLLLRGATGPPVQSVRIPRAVSIHAPLARSNDRRPEVRLDRLVSIHAPLARSNQSHSAATDRADVSIHAPLARSNLSDMPASISKKRFQYMLLLRGATSTGPHWMMRSPFQYMLLLRGATEYENGVCFSKSCFNTCSSCEEQQRLGILG